MKRAVLKTKKQKLGRQVTVLGKHPGTDYEITYALDDLTDKFWVRRLVVAMDDQKANDIAVTWASHSGREIQESGIHFRKAPLFEDIVVVFGEAPKGILPLVKKAVACGRLLQFEGPTKYTRSSRVRLFEVQ